MMNEPTDRQIRNCVDVVMGSTDLDERTARRQVLATFFAMGLL